MTPVVDGRDGTWCTDPVPTTNTHRHRPRPFPTARVLDADHRIAVIAYTVTDRGEFRIAVPADRARVAVRELPAAAASLRHVEMLREMLQVAERFEHGNAGAHEAGSAAWVGGGELPIEEPILIRCAGSGLVGHPMDWLPRTTKSMCQVCGQVWPTFPTRSLQDVLPEHDRIDVAAMVARGDFR